MIKRTKIIVTLGPATNSPEILERIIKAGVDVVRLNFSHGTAQDHIKQAETVRNRARAVGRQVGVMVDLQGPKIRIGKFLSGKIKLKENDLFCIDTNLDINSGDRNSVGCTYKQLSTDLNRGDTLLLDDGRIVLWVRKIADFAIHCRVKVGGILSSNKGINVQGGGLSASSITEKDKQDIEIAAKLEADYIAVSFVQSDKDVKKARKLMKKAGWKGCGVISKIERAEAVEPKIIKKIIQASDAIMVARGDLGVEIGDACLPPMQKNLIRKARYGNIVVITATQMMESMIKNTMPSRAEVFDIANAVLDGTDAVMLSGETAVGKHPVAAVEAMVKICTETEKQRTVTKSGHRIDSKFRRVDESIAMASMYMANHFNVKAIACLTESGSTSLWMSRISSGIPIFAMAQNVHTRRKVTMYRGVYPVSFFINTKSVSRLNEAVINELLRRGVVRVGDFVVVTKGDFYGVKGGTNTIKIIKVGEHILDEETLH